MKKKYYYKQLAQELGVAPMTIYYLINGYKGLPHYTMDKRIARRIAKATGKRPIEYIHPKVRDAYERAWPSLKWMSSGWIKLHRKFTSWGWFKEPNTAMLFIYLLLTANNEQQEWRGMVIERGQLITSRDHLSKATGISQQSIRTGLTRLKSTKEITIKSTSQYSVITICNYDKYQTSKYEINQQVNQLSNKPSTSDQPAINHKQEYKEVKNIKNNIYTHDFERFWKAYPNRHGRKVGKFATFKYYQKKLLNGDKESVIAAASNYANSKTAKDGYAKDPIRFLKDDFWRDWITEHIEPIANDPEVDDFLHSLKKKIKDGNYGNVRSD